MLSYTSTQIFQNSLSIRGYSIAFAGVSDLLSFSSSILFSIPFYFFLAKEFDLVDSKAY